MRITRATLLRILLASAILMAMAIPPASGEDEWALLFDGKSLEGWKANENSGTWSVADGCLVARGKRSHLFYTGPVGNHDFRNFELDVEAKTEPGANSGVFFHTEYQETGWLKKGYEVQINNSYHGEGAYRELKRTGSLYAVRNIAQSFIKDREWFRMRIRVVGKRVRIHVNDHLTVDYLEPEKPVRKEDRSGRILSHGTIALQGHDEKSVVSIRRVAIRCLPDDADAGQPPRASDQGYGISTERMDALCGASLPFIDTYIHLRGGMTVDKAMARQAATGINVGVLRNIGKGWPIETDEQLRAFLDSTVGKPVFVGLQVNDRDWHTKHSPELLKRLDYVLADTMIMAMPDDDGPPQKLWKTKEYTIKDPEAWMKRYVRHTLRILSEPVTILANPTYLPSAVQDRYDELWTDERMKKVIQKAIDNKVALEIQSRSRYPSERFIRMAKEMGATFSFGSNNFNDKPIDLTRCLNVIDTYGLKKKDVYVPEPKR